MDNLKNVQDLMIALNRPDTKQNVGLSNSIAAELGKIGDVRAVPALIEATKTPARAARPVEELLNFLKHKAVEIETEDLQTLVFFEAQIPDIRDVGDNWGVDFGYKQADCSQIRQLAKQELEHRGIPLKEPPIRIAPSDVPPNAPNKMSKTTKKKQKKWWEFWK